MDRALRERKKQHGGRRLQPSVLQLPPPLWGAFQRPSVRGSRPGMRGSCPNSCPNSCLSRVALVLKEPLHLQRSHAACRAV